MTSVTNIDRDGATFTGSASDNGGTTTALLFEVGSDNVSFPVLVQASPEVINSPTSNITGTVSGLNPGTTYYVHLEATNLGGQEFSNVLTFVTLTDPTATIGSASLVTSNSARVSGSVNPRGAETIVVIEYGTDGVTFPSSVGATPGTINGSTDTPVTADITGLPQGATIYFRIRATSAGGTATSGSDTFVLDILSGFTQSFPLTPPDSSGSITVNLSPAGIGSGWRFLGERLWRPPGVSANGFTTGDRDLEFRPVNGYLQPLRELVTVSGNGSLTDLSRDYFLLAGSAGSGSIQVTLQPASVSDPVAVPIPTNRAQWRLLGEDTSAWRDTGESATGLFPGTHIVEFKPIPGRTTPTPVSITVQNGQTSPFTATYRLADSNTGTGTSVVPFSVVTASDTNPYTYVGQIRSDIASGSGFVVKARVVATVGHMVFDDGTLSFVSGLNWSFQRDRGNYEPVPQIPRGFYIFDSYSARRIAENTAGESTPNSQNLDAAALFFLENAGRGGFGGFLASDADDNEFLTSTSLKALVGYPVDGILEADQGRMHGTTPSNVAFTRVPGTDVEPGPDSENFYRLYNTNDLTSVGGNSGGPVCTQYMDGSYYPAAIYLGGSAQTTVRSIDSDVIDLFNRAETSGNGGGNNTGGGVYADYAQNSTDSFNIGLLDIDMSVPSGGWQLEGLDPTTLYREGGHTYALQAGSYMVSFSEIPGFEEPAPIPLTIEAAVTNIVLGKYTQSFETWGALFLSGIPAPLATRRADADFDSLCNLCEMGFNLDPTVADFQILTPTTGTAGLPFASTRGTGSTHRLRLEYIRRKASTTPSLTYRPEFNSEVSGNTWIEGNEISVESINDIWERVISEDPIQGQSVRYGRVSVIETPPP